jgi:hypothetical protein
MAGSITIEAQDSTTGDTSPLKATNDSLHVNPDLGAGERNASSPTNNYLGARPECNLSVISKTTAVTIGGGAANDTRLIGLYLTAALTGTCVITGFADSDGAAQSITLPAAHAAGFKDFGGALNAAGALTITCSNASDDNVVSALWYAV